MLDLEKAPISAAQAAGRKTVNYTCRCCGEPFVSGRTKDDILCYACVNLRRTLRSFQKLGMTPEEIITRAKILLKSQ